MCKTSIFKIFFSLFIQLYIAKVPLGSGYVENFPDPDPTKKGRIRIRVHNPGVCTSTYLGRYRKYRYGTVYTVRYRNLLIKMLTFSGLSCTSRRQSWNSLKISSSSLSFWSRTSLGTRAFTSI